MAYHIKFSDYSTGVSGPPDPAEWIGPPGPPGPTGPKGDKGDQGDLTGGTLTGPLYYTATNGTTPRSAQDRAADVANVIDHGAVLDGVTDDTSAVQAALNCGCTHVVIPAGKTAYCPGGITVPPGVTLDGTSLQMENGNHLGPGGTILVSATTPVAVTLGGGSTNNPCALRHIRVKSTAITPTATTIGVLVNPSIPATLLTDVSVFGFGIGIETVNGITVYLHNIFTGRIADAHYVNNGTPEIHVTKWRMGIAPGSVPVVSNCYIRASGGTGGAGAPNTMRFSQCQFNDAAGTGHLMEFVNYGVAGSDASLYVFENSFCQGVGSAYFYTDATWLDLAVLQIVGCDFGVAAGNPNPCPLFNLNPATSVHELYLSASSFFLSLTLAPTAAAVLKNIHIMGCSFSNGPVSITATTNGTMSFIGNMILNSTLTFNGNWADLSVIGNNFNGGSSLVNNATGNVKIVGTNPYALWLAGIPTPHRSLIGSSLSLNNSPLQGEVEQMTLTGTDLSTGYCATRNTSGGAANGPVFVGQFSRGAAYGTHGAAASGDGMLSLVSYADDGTNFRTQAAAVSFQVDGAVSAGVVPGRIIISTSSAAGTSIQALRLDSAQRTTCVNLTATGRITTSAAGGLNATGTTQADALQLSAQINRVTGVAAGAGVILPAAPLAGDQITIYSAGLNPLRVYCVTGFSIDGASATTGVPLTNGRAAVFTLVGANYVSNQLGANSA